MTYTAHEETYKGFQIDIVQDIDAINPFEDYDCEPMLIAQYDRNVTTYNECDLLDYQLTRTQIIENKADILKALNYQSFRELREDYYKDNIVDAINDAISDAMYDKTMDETIEIMELILDIKGIEYLNTCATGCSQGDYADLFIIATPTWLKLTGIKKADIQKSLKASAKLYESWAFGDVWGFNINDKNGDFFDSCFGFYGPYECDDSITYGGALSEARSLIDYFIKQDNKINWCA